MLRSRGARQMFSLALAVGAAAIGLVSTWGLASAAADLPDGRVYEQVSPANKNGNVVGDPAVNPEGTFGLASEDGNAAVFVGTGAMGTSFTGMINDFVARRSASGWTTSSAIPREQGEIGISSAPLTIVPSSDFSRFLFSAVVPFVSAEPLGPNSSSNIFLSENPAVEPAWVAQPTISDPIPALGQNGMGNYLIAGGTPDFSTVYFTYAGTLLPQDASRAPYVGAGQNLGQEETAPWGFYEWNRGTLSEAGVLPNGTLDPLGAVPAAYAGNSNQERYNSRIAGQAQALDNEVSSDGSRAFFMSPDPSAATAADTPELYVREKQPDGAARTVLVSQSQLPGHAGEPAPDGLVRVENTPTQSLLRSATYVYASPDGSQAFFESTDQLTSMAPADSSVKEYDFDVDTGMLTYLPGVIGPIAAASSDGSDFIFENTATTPSELDLWSGPSGGRVTTIAQLPAPPNVGEPFDGALDISGARASADGPVFVFRTNSPLPGGFNNAGGFAQVYRYDVATSALACVSCPPGGVTPSGNARVSYDNNGEGRPNGANNEPMSVRDTRVISSDGSRVFFDTPDALVPADTNGMRDVYEWENGSVLLISSGKSVDNSYLLDSSASGGDVFFTTDYGLVHGDVDNSYDVYDARIPRPGDVPAPSAVSCQGDVCQGPPSVPSLLGAPASATFSGVGNLAPLEEGTPSVKKKGVRKKHKHKEKAKRRKGNRARKSARKNHGRGN